MTNAYRHVFTELKQRLDSQNFIPTKKNNFLSALQKYFLADLLKDWDNNEQFLFTQRLFTRLINYGLVKLKDDDNTLIYQFSDEQLRENVAKYVISSKPKTVEKLKNVLKSHMNLLQMPTDAQTIAQMLQWLKQKFYIYQIDNKGSYESNLPVKQDEETPANAELITKAMTLLKGKFAKNRPTKRLALVTVFTNQLKITQTEAQQVITAFEKNKKITIPPQGKIIYYL